MIGLTFYALLIEPLCTLLQSVRTWTIIIFFILISFYTVCSSKESDKIIFLLSGDTHVYHTVAKDTTKEIKLKCTRGIPYCSNLTFENIFIDKHTSEFINDANLLIVFGTKAANDPILTAFNRQMIVSMIPKQSDIIIDNNLPAQNVAKIFIDQPFERYLALIKTVMPRASRIGLLLHSSNSSQQNSLIESAENAGFELIIGTVESNDDIGASLSHLLGNIDVLLALPDSRIHNSNTISNILTTSYRNHIPVIGFSSAYVKAGAMAAVYTSLEDISQQVSDVAIQLLRKKHLDTHTILAKYFSISFNFDVARSLGIALRSPSEIKETMLRGDSE